MSTITTKKPSKGQRLRGPKLEALVSIRQTFGGTFGGVPIVEAQNKTAEGTKESERTPVQESGKGNLVTFKRSSKVVILDFDGTLTDVEKEGAPFVGGYTHDLGVLLKRKDIEVLWNEAETERASRPEDFSWDNKGLLVAPASDPYIRSHAILDLILDKLGLFSDPEKRTEIKNQLFGANYKKSITAFREGAKEFLEELIANMKIIVVTNSGTDAVQAKLEQLNPKSLNEVALFGNARKFEVDNSWDSVSEGQSFEGLKRLVLLRRRLYSDILSKISKEFKVPIESMQVMGDIYDLDLAFPQHLGMGSALITREHTYAYEKRAAQAVVHDFEGARRFFEI
jgi:FMN phosphatase YigB (HAD superfamily)